MPKCPHCLVQAEPSGPDQWRCPSCGRRYWREVLMAEVRDGPASARLPSRIRRGSRELTWWFLQTLSITIGVALGVMIAVFWLGLLGILALL